MVEEIEECVGFFNLETDDTARKDAVDVQRLFASYWVSTDQRVDVLDWGALDLFFTPLAFAGTVGLIDARVNDGKCLEVCGKTWREAFISVSLVDVARVATRRGRVEEKQSCQTGWLQLIRYVTVPRCTARAVGDIVV